MKRSILQIALLTTLLTSSSLRLYAMDEKLPPPPDLKMTLELLSPISTSTAKKGDKFSCKVLAPVQFTELIVEGYIRDVKRSGKVDKESKIDLAFQTITGKDGQSVKFSASVVEVFEVQNAADQGVADNEGTVRSKSSTVKTSVKRAATGALIGAGIGALIAGEKGAIIGATIGASAGVTSTLAQRGPDLEFKKGTQFSVVTSGRHN